MPGRPPATPARWLALAEPCRLVRRSSWSPWPRLRLPCRYRADAGEPGGAIDGAADRREALLRVTEQLRRHRQDRSRPLWEMWFLTGLPERQIGLFACIHHAIADGIAGVATLGAFLDATPSAPAGPARPSTPAPVPPGPARRQPSPPGGRDGRRILRPRTVALAPGHGYSASMFEPAGCLSQARGSVLWSPRAGRRAARASAAGPASADGLAGRTARAKTQPTRATAAAVSSPRSAPLMKAERATWASRWPVVPPTRAATPSAPPIEPRMVFSIASGRW